MKTGDWIQILIDAVGCYMHLETSEGIIREGRISGFTFRTFKLGSKIFEVPTEMELNGDPNDRVPVDRIVSIAID